jgi:hypothetical protein
MVCFYTYYDLQRIKVSQQTNQLVEKFLVEFMRKPELKSLKRSPEKGKSGEEREKLKNSKIPLKCRK